MNVRLRVLAVFVSLIWCNVAGSQDAVSKAMDATIDANRASRVSQQKIDQLDDQTRQMLERYRSASWQAQQLTVYAN
jgi:hypothetical protein